MNIKEALAKLYSIHQFSIKLGLDNIIKLLEYLGNPQNKFKSIHIAGSNGKGSTASFTASILTEAGYKTGLYTSPHLVRFNERVRINGIEIPDLYITEFMNEMNSYIDKYSPTFFEITTALAFKYFAENNIDIGVIETGLGGRLDATNTITPLASIITTISLEHTNILGKTIEEIAKEKAGIIKQGVPLFAGLIDARALKVIEESAIKSGSDLYKFSKFAQIKNDSVNINYDGLNYNIYKTPLIGNHQLRNSALAAFSLYKTLNIKSPKIFSGGINKVIKNSGIQGRYEIYNEKPKVIFDASHNFEGIETFIEEFKKESILYDKKYLIYGAMNDKDIIPILKLLKDYFDIIYFTSINYERAFKAEELEKAGKELKICNEILPEPAEFVSEFISLQNSNCLVVLGSIYLLGEIKLMLSDKRT
ncbi:MAG: bifunctional folylpolyglutamate synthase/dihydrofolate synthase [Bacteroidetes bacterium]|nr:bifunctional folylpolyglutamate synthase/dihydrofolate synthase [Bacteroidota bacterium]